MSYNDTIGDNKYYNKGLYGQGNNSNGVFSYKNTGGYSYGSKRNISSLDTESKNQNQVGPTKNAAALQKTGGGGNNGSGGNEAMAEVEAGVAAVKDVATIWSIWQQNKLARKEFKFNKEMAIKNYNMAKQAYDDRRHRSATVNDNMFGSQAQERYKDLSKDWNNNSVDSKSKQISKLDNAIGTR
jgi:hypothetical protein